MRYVMITRWEDHWDKVYTASFTRPMVKGDLTNIQNNVKTTFIKISKTTGKIEKAWQGYVDNIDKKASKVDFRVNINAEVPVSKVKSYSDKREGWYIYTDKKKV